MVYVYVFLLNVQHSQFLLNKQVYYYVIEGYQQPAQTAQLYKYTKGEERCRAACQHVTKPMNTQQGALFINITQKMSFLKEIFLQMINFFHRFCNTNLQLFK